MLRAAFAIFGMLMFPAIAAAAPSESCRPLGLNRAELIDLKANAWGLPDEASRDRLVIEAASCLGNPDPVLRDEIATEAIQHQLRNRLVTEPAMLQLAGILKSQLIAVDPDGFLHPFAALSLAEVARADRIKPFLTVERRADLLAVAIAYMRSIRDYRAFDPAQGYRHAVAHGADLMMQLALNPALDKEQLVAIRDAVASQITPTGQYYVTGESERLARPILYIAQRGLLTEAEWNSWFEQISALEQTDIWKDWYRSHEGLARRHNLMAFLSAIYLNANLSGNAGFAPLLPGAVATLKTLP